MEWNASPTPTATAAMIQGDAAYLPFEGLDSRSETLRQCCDPPELGLHSRGEDHALSLSSRTRGGC